MWMIVSTRTLSRVATILDKTDDTSHYKELADSLKIVLREHFWDDSRQMYDDFYIDENGKKQFDGHIGYINFFPFFLDGIDPDDDRFETVWQKLIANETGLWTEFGIRSLSKYDPYYRLGDNYWTSPIWMNINFLIFWSIFGQIPWHSWTFLGLRGSNWCPKLQKLEPERRFLNEPARTDRL